MRLGQEFPAMRDLERLFARGTLPRGDRALLDCFLLGGDERAFEALVGRHGPMVLGVCRRLLADPDDADDAFQATFLILVRKARAIRDADRLAPWLHGVATRVSLKARARAARRRERHQYLTDEAGARDDPAADRGDFRPILDAELDRISRKLREVVVLCLLEGATAAEAAERLACPLGTVKSRLARGREALRHRLTARGVAPAVALIAVAGSGSGSTALASPLSPTLIRLTSRLSSCPEAGVAPAVATLSRGLTMSLLPKSPVLAFLALAGSSLVAVGVAAWVKAPAAAQEPGADAIAPAARSADAEPLDQAVAHMKQILTAVHNFVSNNDHLPATIFEPRGGQPRLSWRVSLLPYIEQGELYDGFRQDEPWDSPHNKALIPRMPKVFECPAAPAGPGLTRFRAYQGPGALLELGTAVRIVDITDGTSNTVLFAVAGDAVPWTAPDELPFDGKARLEDLASIGPKGKLLGMMDGQIRSLPIDRSKILDSIITRNGGEIVSWSAEPEGPRPAPDAPGLAPTPTPPIATAGRTTVATLRDAGPRAAPAGGAAPGRPLTVEERLEHLERKMDLILRKLDAAPPAPR